MSKPLKSRIAKSAIRNAVPKQKPNSHGDAKDRHAQKIVIDGMPLRILTDNGPEFFASAALCSVTKMILDFGIGRDEGDATLSLMSSLKSHFSGSSGAQT